MPCYHPLQAYKSLSETTESGKALIVFKRSTVSSKPFQKISLPCGQCIGCRIKRSREWALRCVHEASLYTNNCFITLTFNDQNLNKQKTLVKSDFQKFMKRLRKSHKGIDAVAREDGTLHYPIRYFHCGEYGSKLERPHHHACLFNFDFADKVLWSTRKNVRLYRSAELERIWPYGFCTIGAVEYSSAAYVARYVTKKINGERALQHYAHVDEDTGEMHYVLPEYITMSRRPGLGYGWFDKFSGDVYPKDFITEGGKRFPPPSYYDRIYDHHEPDILVRIKKKRRLRACKNQERQLRLNAKEKCMLANQKRAIRSYEK